jgi:dihydropteroate synthase
LRNHYPEAIISVDTFRAGIARQAVEMYKVNIINDISGGADAEMFPTVAELDVPYILTHSQPLPQEQPAHVAVLEYFARQGDVLHRMGVKDVIADPGFGFNKNEAQNYEILAHLSDLLNADLPLLVGLSRKSMFYKPLETTPTSDLALAATIAANTLALKGGASILRVHDVAAAKAAITIVSKTI